MALLLSLLFPISFGVVVYLALLAKDWVIVALSVFLFIGIMLVYTVIYNQRKEQSK